MNSSEAIGGYFELELRRGAALHSDAIQLNSGRACFEYVLRSKKPKHVWLPKYICEAMLQPLIALEIPFDFYEINEALEPSEVPDSDDEQLFVVVNYFGIKDVFCRAQSAGTVIDASQAYFFGPNLNSHTLYSPRKFFGVPDGGELVTSLQLDFEVPIDQSSQRFSHLLKRYELGPQLGFADFSSNEELIAASSMSRMSLLTRALLGNINYEVVANARNANFAFVHEQLGDKNRLACGTHNAAPLAYPFWTDDHSLRQRLIDAEIFVPRYWLDVLNRTVAGELEHELAQNVIPLPIDQRYGLQEMQRIVDVINAG